MNPPLPTDEEYLDYVYRVYRDPRYIETFGSLHADFDLQRQFQQLVESGRYRPDQLEEFRALSGETFALDKAFRGRLIHVLKDVTFRILGDAAPRVSAIPIGLLPTSELNAAAIATPRGGSVIILNHGVLAHLMLVCRCTLAFITWRTDEPFCRDAPQDAYADALIALARHLVTGDVRQLVPHKETLRFPSLSDYEETTILFCEMIEIFILLHEYGHVLSGHLDEASLRPAFAGAFPEIMEYSKSELQEFEADRFAIDRMLGAMAQGEQGMRPTDVALGVGILMKLFELCERLTAGHRTEEPRTHPPASARWSRVKAATRLSEHPGAFAANLDPAFEAIAEVLDP